MPWTKFWDMHSGGGLKEAPFQFIFIEAPRDEAVTIFYNRYGHNPNRVSCTCCGEDYVVEESPTIEEATEFHRKDERRVELAEQDKYLPYDDPSIIPLSVREYGEKEYVLFIRADEIKPEERKGRVPRQGYVWIDEDEEIQ